MRRFLLVVNCVIFCSLSFAEGYIGGDVKYQLMKGNNKYNYNFNRNIPKTYSAFEVYYGDYFEENISFELGYVQVLENSKEYTFNQGETFLGTSDQGGTSSKLSYKSSGLAISFNGYVELMKDLFIFGQLGVVANYNTYTFEYIENGATALPDFSNRYGFVPRIGVGFTYKILKDIEARIIARYQGTKLLRSTISDDNGYSYKVNPFRNSFDVGAGLVFNI